jgi:hypothetical protein
MNTKEIVDRLTTGGQEALERASSELSSNPVTAAALQRAAEARERVDALGVSALGQLHLPTAEAVEEVAAKVRAVATRAERIEGVLAELVERLDRIEAKLDGRASAPGVDVTPPADVMPIRRD